MPAACGARRLVLCCVKSTDTAQAAAEMAPHLAPDAIVLSLQNGYDNAARLQALLGRRCIPPWSMSPPRWPGRAI
jgi:2-dehydropantoate 2-reductase